MSSSLCLLWPMSEVSHFVITNALSDVAESREEQDGINCLLILSNVQLNYGIIFQSTFIINGIDGKCHIQNCNQ